MARIPITAAFCAAAGGRREVGLQLQPGQSMKKHGLLVLCAWILALMAISTFALADEDPITCAIELSPAYLAGPGEVAVTITISNTTDADLQDPVTLFSPNAEVITDFGDNGSALLKAGESKTWTGTYNVSERELEQGYIQYFVKFTSYKENGQAVPSSSTILAVVEQREAEAALDVERTITPASAHEGQEVQVKYTLVNAGTVALTDIIVTENSDVNDKPQTIARLEPGYKAEIPYPVTMGTEDLTSSATITYKADGSTEELSHTVEEKVIPFAQTDLTATLSSDVKGVVSGGTMKLTLELKNKGSVDMTDIRVTDAILGDVFTNQKVEAGSTLTLEKEITLTETSEYQFVINAIDSTGTEVSTASNVLSVTAMNPEDALNLTLTAVPDRTEVYDDPAGVRFTLTITNDSRVDATNVVISHGYVELYTFDSIKAGESRTMSRDTVLSTSGKFQFTAVAKDPLENESTFISNEMQIAVYEPTPVPATPTPPPEPTPEPTFVPVTWAPIHDPSIGTIPKAIQSVLLPALIVAGVLLLACTVLLVIAGKRRHDNKKASDAAFDHLERARRRDYVTVNPEELAAASKATLSQNQQADETEDADGFLSSGDAWDLPPYDAVTMQQEQEYSEQEGYSSFGQGFYGDMGDEGFEPTAQPTDESYGAANEQLSDYNQQETYQPTDDQGYGYQQPEAYQQSEDYQPESFGDDRMSYDEQAGFESRYSDPYLPTYDGYEPLGSTAPEDGSFAGDGFPQGNGADQNPRSRRARK